MYEQRRPFYEALEKARGSKVIAYVTGDRPGMEAQISADAIDYIVEHLDTFGLPKRISLYLYSQGGETLAGWSIVNLIRHFCDEFEVIVPSKARSTATLIALGADKIVMTKQATLGPIDPSINGPLNPQAPGGQPHQRVAVSVEDVAGYFELIRSQGISDPGQLALLFQKLATEVHPLALGSVFRAREQIKRLAQRLLGMHMADQNTTDKIISVLCSESGSHDYTINRREAEHELKLPVEKPGDDLYGLIRRLYDDIRTDLCLGSRFDPSLLAATAKDQPNVSYYNRRALVESVSGGSDLYVTSGAVTPISIPGPVPQTGALNQIEFEGWEHVST